MAKTMSPAELQKLIDSTKPRKPRRRNELWPGEVKFASYNVRLSRTILQRLAGVVGPSGTLRCGQCLADWTQQIPVVYYPRIPCPACGRVNVLPIEPV